MMNRRWVFTKKNYLIYLDSVIYKFIYEIWTWSRHKVTFIIKNALVSFFVMGLKGWMKMQKRKQISILSLGNL